MDIEKIVRILVKYGFIHGFFGDTSEEFIIDKVEQIKSLSPEQQLDWFRGHEHNFRNNCGFTNVIFRLGGEFLYGTIEERIFGVVDGNTKSVFAIGRYIIKERDCYFPS